MKKSAFLILVATHCVAGLIGFGVGIYVLPIVTAPPSPSDSEISAMSSQSAYTGQFRRDLKDSDALHWGQGTISVGSKVITFRGKLAPGPDYKLYLSPQFVETEADFNRLKSTMVRVGNVNTFDNFVVDVPTTIDTAEFTSVIIWCESFGQFITAASYR